MIAEDFNRYRVNRDWSDRFLPQIKQLVGGYLLETAADPFDYFQATDLMMLLCFAPSGYPRMTYLLL